VFPTNDDQVLAFVAVPAAERFTGAELEARYEDELFRFEGVREAFAAATRASRVLGMVDLPNFFRVSSGPGWALAGDAGHHKDPLVARGISDAFRDADALAEAITSSLERGPAHLDAALAAYAALRDAACRDVYRLNLMIASSELSSMERTAELYAALADAESAADARFGVDLPALAPA
jgi:flavin-dependent dehydrogenase